MERDYGKEIEELKEQVNEIFRILQVKVVEEDSSLINAARPLSSYGNGSVMYTGEVSNDDHVLHAVAKKGDIQTILSFQSENMATILSAIAHKQRIEIIKTLLGGPKSGLDLVAELNMGTTGQLYHHLKPLLSANLITQAERGGNYHIPLERTIPLLLLLSAVTDMYETSHYLKMTETREQSDDYLDKGQNRPNQLLLALIHNSIEEHKAGHCHKVLIVPHDDGSITVSDDGRGIPLDGLAPSNKTNVEEVLTNLDVSFTQYKSSREKKPLEVSIVNALSMHLRVIVKRNGLLYHQEFCNGIPKATPSVIGEADRTGTSFTITPNQNLFTESFDLHALQEEIETICTRYPKLTITILNQ